MPAGFKLFANGDVLKASEVMDFVMSQQICVFDNAATRNAAIANPFEGQFAYTRDGNTLFFYNGNDWKVF